MYRKITSSNTSRLEAHVEGGGLFKTFIYHIVGLVANKSTFLVVTCLIEKHQQAGLDLKANPWKMIIQKEHPR